MIKLPEHFPADVREFFKTNWDLRLDLQPFEPVNEHNITHATGLPFLELPFTAPHKRIAAEAAALYERFTVFEPRKASHYLGLKTPIYEQRDDASGWKALTLHGLGAEKAGHHSNYGFDESLSDDQIPYKWTDVAVRAPETVSWIKQTLPVEKLYRVRFMILEPGSCVFPHKGKLDPNGRCGFGPINIAIINPREFYFLVKGAGTVPFRPGRCFWFAPGFEHSLVNLSTVPRLHMIVEAKFKPEFYNSALSAYKKAVEPCPQIKHVFQRIKRWL